MAAVSFAGDFFYSLKFFLKNAGRLAVKRIHGIQPVSGTNVSRNCDLTVVDGERDGIM